MTPIKGLEQIHIVHIETDAGDFIELAFPSANDAYSFAGAMIDSAQSRQCFNLNLVGVSPNTHSGTYQEYNP